jgi:uncharacterized protein YndB with AHSA1/START domain
MERLEYKVVISAPAKTVWETMLGKETYEQWVAKSWPDSHYEGTWEKGGKIRFIGPDGSGTLAEIVELKPNERVLVRHIAILTPGGQEDRTSDTAKGWVGITEEYVFSEKQGQTTVSVNIETPEEWRKMFDDGWPAALDELKSLSERQLEAAR